MQKWQICFLTSLVVLFVFGCALQTVDISTIPWYDDVVMRTTSSGEVYFYHQEDFLTVLDVKVVNIEYVKDPCSHCALEYYNEVRYVYSSGPSIGWMTAEEADQNDITFDVEYAQTIDSVLQMPYYVRFPSLFQYYEIYIDGMLYREHRSTKYKRI